MHLCTAVLIRYIGVRLYEKVYTCRNVKGGLYEHQLKQKKADHHDAR